MTDRWQLVVAQLYNHLGLRLNRLRLTLENCPVLADVLYVLRQRPPVQIEPDVVTAIALLVANVAPLPPSLVKALPSLAGSVRLLIFQTAGEVGVPREMIHAMHRLTGAFFTVLKARLRIHHAPLPPVKAYPLAGFHGRAWRDARVQGWVLQYLAYALTVHRRLLVLRSEMERSPKPFGMTKIVNNLYLHCLGARYLLPRLPRPASPALSEPPDADLEAAITAIRDEPSRRRRHLLLRRARQFLRLLTDVTIRPAVRRPGKVETRALPIPSELRRGAAHLDLSQPATAPGPPPVVLAEDGDDDEADNKENARTPSLRRLWVGPSNLEDALAEGESVWDYAEEVVHEVEPAAEDGRQAIWRLRWQRQRVIMTGQESTLTARTLQAHEFAMVYRVTFTSADDDSLEDRLVQAAAELFLELLTIHGMDPHDLERAMLDIEPTGAGALWFDSTASLMAYRVPREWVAWRDRPLDLPPEHCRPGSDLVRVPLLPLVGRTLQRLITLRREFGLTDPALFALGRGGLLTAEALDEVLREYCGQRVTCRRLARSTLAWLRHYGAPHVVRSLVSARPLPAARATLFYTNVQQAVLARRLVEAATPFQRQIRAALAADGNVPKPLDEPGLFDSPPLPMDHIGSRIVPEFAHVRACFEGLRGRLRRCPPDVPLPVLAEGFNLFALYCTLGLLWLTGSRPLRDPFPAAPITAPSPWVFVPGKGNRDYSSEGRLVPLCRTALALHVEFQEGCQRIISLLALRGTALTPSGRVFFLAPTGDSTLPVTGTHAKALLHQLGLQALYRFPLNAHRHRWISQALEEGLLEVFEPYLGHLHVGTEPWGRFSVADPEAEAEQFRAFAERLAEAVGIIPVAHPFRE